MTTFTPEGIDELQLQCRRAPSKMYTLNSYLWSE